jgi:hypothetical protein
MERLKRGKTVCCANWGARGVGSVPNGQHRENCEEEGTAFYLPLRGHDLRKRRRETSLLLTKEGAKGNKHMK